jgi:hypothetical protein
MKIRLSSIACVSVVAVVGLPTASEAQACADPHYRWREKIDLSLANQRPTQANVVDILNSWAPRTITSKDKCAPRTSRETQTFAVVGWVRRVKTLEADADWHIEITAEEADPVTSCMIVEIPAMQYGAVYLQARNDMKRLLAATKIDPQGDLSPPIQVQFTGAALFDGFHQALSSLAGGARASGHGRCNSSVRALWEIHPVYRVMPASQANP